MANAFIYVCQEHTVSKEEQLTLSDSASWQHRVPSPMQSLEAVMTTLEGEFQTSPMVPLSQQVPA